jgi:hypothetical protein
VFAPPSFRDAPHRDLRSLVPATRRRIPPTQASRSLAGQRPANSRLACQWTVSSAAMAVLLQVWVRVLKARRRRPGTPEPMERD